MWNLHVPYKMVLSNLPSPCSIVLYNLPVLCTIAVRNNCLPFTMFCVMYSPFIMYRGHQFWGFSLYPIEWCCKISLYPEIVLWIIPVPFIKVSWNLSVASIGVLWKRLSQFNGTLLALMQDDRL